MSESKTMQERLVRIALVRRIEHLIELWDTGREPLDEDALWSFDSVRPTGKNSIRPSGRKRVL